MEIGIDSFVATMPDALTGENFPPEERLAHLLQEIKLADELGLDVFGIGEHHRAEFLDSAPETLLAAAAAVTRKIRLTSAVTVLSAFSPSSSISTSVDDWVLADSHSICSMGNCLTSFSPLPGSAGSSKKRTQWSP